MQGERDLTGATIAELRERDREWKAYEAERGRLVCLYQRGEIAADGLEIQQLEEWFQRLANGRPRWLANQEPRALRKALARRGDPEATEAERMAHQARFKRVWDGPLAGLSLVDLHAPLRDLHRQHLPRPLSRPVLTRRRERRARRTSGTRGSPEPSRPRPRPRDLAHRAGGVR